MSKIFIEHLSKSSLNSILTNVLVLRISKLILRNLYPSSSFLSLSLSCSTDQHIVTSYSLAFSKLKSTRFYPSLVYCTFVVCTAVPRTIVPYRCVPILSLLLPVVLYLTLSFVTCYKCSCVITTRCNDICVMIFEFYLPSESE